MPIYFTLPSRFEDAVPFLIRTVGLLVRGVATFDCCPVRWALPRPNSFWRRTSLKQQVKETIVIGILISLGIRFPNRFIDAGTTDSRAFWIRVAGSCSCSSSSSRAGSSACSRSSSCSCSCSSSAASAICRTLRLFWATAPRREEVVNGVGHLLVTFAYVNTARGPEEPASP